MSFPSRVKFDAVLVFEDEDGVRGIGLGQMSIGGASRSVTFDRPTSVLGVSVTHPMLLTSEFKPLERELRSRDAFEVTLTP